MVLTWPNTIKIAPILGIWTEKYLIQPMESDLMGGHRYTRDRDESIFRRDLPK